MGGGDIDLSQIPLMTKAQEQALEQLLPAVMGMMSGFPLGEAYQPGAYNARTFPEFGSIPQKNGDRYGGNGDKIRRDQLVDPNKRITKEQLTAPDGGGGGGGGDGKKEIISNGTAVPKAEYGGTVTEEQIREPVLDLILNPEQYMSPIKQLPTSVQPSIPQQPPTSIPSMGGGGKGGTPGIAPATQPISPIQQILTQPFTQPFREGMTGNYPRQPIGGR